MLIGIGRASYPTNPEGLTTPADIATAAEARIDACERGESGKNETMARSMPQVMALMRAGS